MVELLKAFGVMSATVAVGVGVLTFAVKQFIGPMLNTWAKRITDDFDRQKQQLNETTRLVQNIHREVHIKTTGELYLLDQRRSAVVDFFVTNRRILVPVTAVRLKIEQNQLVRIIRRFSV